MTDLKAKQHLEMHIKYSRFFKTVFVSILLLASVSAHAKDLFILYSDSHSAYQNVPAFLRAVTTIAEKFRRENPTGRVILAANGDIGGAALYSDHDLGKLNYELIEALSPYMYPVLVVGNHEGMDFVGTRQEPATANTTFLRHTIDFVKAIHERRPDIPIGQYGVLAGNLILGPHGKGLFRSYLDIPAPVGDSPAEMRGKPEAPLRVIGLVLNDLIRNTSYDVTSPIQIFTGVEDMLKRAKIELRRAAKDKIKKVVLLCHEEDFFMGPFIEKIMEWKSGERNLSNLEILFVGGGHDHKVFDKNYAGVRYVEAGENYAFSTVEVGDQNELSVRHYPVDEQVKSFPSDEFLFSNTRAVLERAQNEVIRINRENAEVLGIIPKITQGKFDLKRGRTLYGSQLSQITYDWAAHALKQEGVDPPPHQGIIVFFNSSGYRMTRNLPAGDLTRAHVKEMRPFQRRPGIVMAKGRQIEKIYTELRHLKCTEAEYCPQMSVNVREVPLGSGQRVERDHLGLSIFSSEKNEFIPLDPEGIYALVLDDYIFGNFYRLESLSELYRENPWMLEAKNTTQELFAADLPRVLNQWPGICAEMLKPAPSRASSHRSTSHHQ